MAVKKKAATDAAKPGKKSGALMSYDEMIARLQEQAQAASARETAGLGGQKIQVRGKHFVADDADLGETISVVVLASAYVNTYYDRPYDPEGDATSPACYAVALEEADLASAEDSPAAQSEGGAGNPCATCWANQFESAQTGRGKACRNGRRLILKLMTDVEEHGVEGAPSRELTLSPKALKHWGRYVRGLARVHKMPPHGVVTEFSFDPNSEYPIIVPRFADALGPEQLAAAVEATAEAEDEALRPFDVSSYEPPRPVGKRPTAGVKVPPRPQAGKRSR